ncbi:MAG: LysM peptidoglycan-binding domain-containing protein [Firmicutes bacterium]|nr:LysM peptidoglycan-binding domain-containing protein [Bacillota bacterium]
MLTITGKRVLIFGMTVVFFVLSSIVRGQNYYVQPGDSLHKIAARYGTSVAALQENNGLKTTQIYPGQILSLARRRKAPANSTYTVRPGDSLVMIAKRYQVSISALQETNKISASYVTTGQTLKIPLSKGGAANPSSITYIVKNGEPLYLIAKRHRVSVIALLETNHLSNVSAVWPGQRLLIPKSIPDSGNPAPKFNLSKSDLDLLARLVSAESTGEPFQGQVAVAATVLNRLEDSRYPNTIPGVVYQVESGRYQYSPVLDGRINQPASPSAYQAVEQAIQGTDPSNGANGFYNPTKTTNLWVRSQPVTATIGNHVFFRY